MALQTLFNKIIGRKPSSRSLHLLPDEQYNDFVVRILKEKAEGKRVCYVTLNKTSLAVKEILNHEGIVYENYYFIDAVTPKLFKRMEIKNCTFVDDMGDIEALAKKIYSIVSMQNTEVIIIDSLSTLLSYSSEKDMLLLIETLTSMLEKRSTDLLLFARYADRDLNAIKQASMKVDQAVVERPLMVIP
jgi:KaiC/GvpD/RAD55 family RecA-like ATPase